MDEVDRALTAAEAELVAIRRTRTGVVVIRCAEVLAFAAGFVHPLGLLVALVLALLSELLLVRTINRTLVARYREMMGSVVTVRETFIHIAHREKWPATRIAHVRQRVSQFPIDDQGGHL
ncbi:hypothetical protein AB0E59_18895 [Lentzea sp. NPDC034063]|uniref:hypothetical protein n=1 Tax=unclassified Lentzea TaxID=2643253 RepID=UPI0033C5EDD5